MLAETDLHAVLATLERERPEVCVIDSVQTLHSGELTSGPGSVAQVREVAGQIMQVAKERGMAVLLVGHVTKEGSLAGPRVLEHLVDCVLQFEGERERTYRTVRAIKNRFGSTNEVGVFEMHEQGLIEVLDASAPVRGSRPPGPRGALSCARWRAHARCSWRCRRWWPARSSCPLAGSWPALTAIGWRWCWPCSAATEGSALGAADVFVNVVGGVRVEEPGADLAVALAVASAAKRVPLAAGAVPLACFGEIGLTGELRSVAHGDRRLAEAAKFGLGPAIEPEAHQTLRAALAAALGSRTANQSPSGGAPPHEQSLAA